jgi:hypothetical protein
MPTNINLQKLHRLRLQWLERNASLRALSEDLRQLTGHHGRTEPAGTVQSEGDYQHAFSLRTRIAELELEVAPMGALVVALETYAAKVTGRTSPPARSGPLTSREVAA